MDAMLTKVVARLDQYGSRIVTCNQRLSKTVYKPNMEALNDELTVAQETAAVLEQDLDALKRQSMSKMDMLRSELEDAIQDRKDALNKAAGLEYELEMVQASRHEKERQLKAAECEVECWEAAESKARKQNEQLQIQLASKEALVSELTLKVAGLTEELQQLQSTVNAKPAQASDHLGAAGAEPDSIKCSKQISGSTSASTTTATPQVFPTPAAKAQSRSVPHAPTPGVVKSSPASTTAIESPPSDRKRAPQPDISKGICICLTGFKPGMKGYELEDKVKATAAANALGFKLHVGSSFSEDVTHVIAPPECRTIKVLAATLQCRWLMPIQWLYECQAAERALPELDYNGRRLTSSPFANQKLRMTDEFCKAAKESKIRNVHLLFETYGGGHVVTTGEVDVWLAMDDKVPEGVSHLTWSGLLGMIPTYYNIRSCSAVTRTPLSDNNASAPRNMSPSPKSTSKRATSSVELTGQVLQTPSTVSHKKPKLSLSRKR
eukprot:TRINITY_DN5540_c0_g1_i1.p1 TRINITY_DN5540_c0_g1~~TRINITY_DN5540_c0_g1_i1.p1  ORF type:complete len:511 (+),score=113.86 TRINITY_DN5540_c0_g1_i1:55-1533(+)